jgi:hypothetical protein
MKHIVFFLLLIIYNNIFIIKYYTHICRNSFLCASQFSCISCNTTEYILNMENIFDFPPFPLIFIKSLWPMFMLNVKVKQFFVFILVACMSRWMQREGYRFVNFAHSTSSCGSIIWKKFSVLSSVRSIILFRSDFHM